MNPKFPKSGWYVKLPIPVWAEQQDEDFIVRTLEGRMEGERGDWLITGFHGEQWPIRDDIFRETYRLDVEEE